MDPERLRRELVQRRVGERVVQHDLSAREVACTAQRDEIAGTGAGADEDHDAAFALVHGVIVDANTWVTPGAPAARRWCGGSPGPPRSGRRRRGCRHTAAAAALAAARW